MSSNIGKVYLFTGNDEIQIAGASAKLMLDLAGPDPDPFASDILSENDSCSGSDLLLRLLSSIDSPSFTGAEKVIWLKNYSAFSSEPDSKDKKRDSHPLTILTQRIRKGLPAKLVLILSGVGCDGRKALAKACQETGEVRVLNKPDTTKRQGIAEMTAILRESAAAKKVQIDYQAMSLLIELFAGNTALIDSELEKLACYCGGENSTITAEAVESLCVSQTEEQPWALSNALGTASLKECLNVINNIVAKSKDEESSGRSLIMTAANFFRDCLKMRIFMQEKRFSNGNDVYNYLNQRASDQNKTKAERGSIEAMHPFRAKNIAEQALRYRPAQMVKAIKALRDAAWQVNSSTISPKKALENALVGLGISKSPRSKSPKSDKNLQLGTCN